MSRPMTLKEFADVVNFAKDHNGPFATSPVVDRYGKRVRIPMVKYIDPHLDLRSNTVFSITFRGFGIGSEKLFHCQNECRDLPESLYDRCMTYLRGE